MPDAIRDVHVRISVGSVNQQVAPPKVDNVVSQLKKVEQQAVASGAKLAESFEKASTGVLQLSRGFALLAFHGDENLQRLLKQLALLQAGFDLMRGSVNIVRSLTEAHKALAIAATASAAAQAASGAAGGGGAIGFGARMLGARGIAGLGAVARVGGPAAIIAGASFGVGYGLNRFLGFGGQDLRQGTGGWLEKVPFFGSGIAAGNTATLNEQTAERNQRMLDAERMRLTRLQEQQRVMQQQLDTANKHADKLREMNRTIQDGIREQLNAGRSAQDRFAAMSPGEQRTTLGLARQGFGRLNQFQLGALEGLFPEQVRQERLRRANPNDLSFVAGLGSQGARLQQQDQQQVEAASRVGSAFALGAVGLSLDATEKALEAMGDKAKDLDRTARNVEARLRTLEEGIRNQ